MADTTVIGRSTFVRGRVHGSGDVEVAGRLEGDLSCAGEATVESGGLVAANITARRIVVRGAVKGDLTAEDTIAIGSGGRVVGDLRAPRIGIAEGGLVRGHVQTAAAGAARPRAATAVTTTSRSSAASRSREEEKPKAKAAPPPASSSASSKSKSNGPSKPRGATLAGARIGPPPPVVPVLKKGAKAVQKKAR
jgi:cytoskeletal protein CcmA (bactofilin family)